MLGCGDKFKDQIGLQTHMRESVISTDSSFANQGTCFADNYTIKSSSNQKQLYFTKPGSHFNDFN